MTHHGITDRTLALAGIFQAAGLVQEMANRGGADPLAFRASISSIFETSPATTAEVFGGSANLRQGLEWLVEHLSGKQVSHKNPIVKYVVGVLYLERQLAKKPGVLERIRVGIEKARLQSEHFSVTHINVVANLAACYSDTISNLRPRIIVSGERNHLSNPMVANTVRALLLAAIRSAVLWRQCGGNRLQLLLGRSKLLAEARRQLTHA